MEKQRKTIDYVVITLMALILLAILLLKQGYAKTIISPKVKKHELEKTIAVTVQGTKNNMDSPKKLEKTHDLSDKDSLVAGITPDGEVYMSKGLKDELKKGLEGVENFLERNKYIIMQTIVFLSVIFFILSIRTIFILVEKSIILTKAGKPFWAVFVPYYRTIVFYEITKINPAYIFIPLIAIIPWIGWAIAIIAGIVLMVKANINLAQAFGKEKAFAIGLIFLPTIFLGILSFGKSEYNKAYYFKEEDMKKENKKVELAKKEQIEQDKKE